LKLLEEVPLHIEDKPPKRLKHELQIEFDEDLCGYFAGLPLNRQYEHSARIPNSITVFRRGIWAKHLDEAGQFCLRELRRQIRITILHELAHYHGIEEDELEQLGYG
jgi:predicted Zn-dependent protease with MMP-like domain